MEDAKDEHKRLLRRAPGKEAARQAAAGDQQRLAIQARGSCGCPCASPRPVHVTIPCRHTLNSQPDTTDISAHLLLRFHSIIPGV